MIPLVDLRAQCESIRADVEMAIARVVGNTAFILGDEVREFEEEFAKYCGADHAVGTASGTSALHLALLASGIGEGDEVITTPHTFIATVEAIWQTGAKPVFVDIDPATFNLDASRIVDVLTDRTAAIVPVHLYGQPADMAEISEIADAHGLSVVQDAAQAHGAEYDGRRIGELGCTAVFSFYPGKNLGAYGDAGMVVTSDPRIYERVRMLRNHGRSTKYEHEILGFGERLDALQAAILQVKLPHLGEWTRRRQSAADAYRRRLAGVAEVTLPTVVDDRTHVYHLFVVRVPNRDSVLEHLRAAGVGAGVHYPVPLHLQPALRWLKHTAGDFPVTEAVAGDCLSLPLFPEISEGQVDEVCTVLEEALRLEENPVGTEVGARS